MLDDTFATGIAPVEFLPDGNVRLRLVVTQMSYGATERVVVQRSVVSRSTLEAISEALAQAVRVGPRSTTQGVEIVSGLN